MERNCLDLDVIVSELCRKGLPLNDNRAFFRELTREILGRVGCKFSLATPTPVERVRVLLGMDLSFSQELLGDAHSNKREDNWEIEITSDQTYFDGSQQWLTVRGRFSLAHEMAHFILDYIEEKCPRSVKALRLGEENAERLCDFISSELLLPSYLFEHVSLKDTIRITKVKSGYLKESFLLSIDILDTLRKSLKVSRIALIQKLDQTSLLNEAECGIIVSMFGVNRNTGRSPALRVYKASVPSWGFIPHNIRLSTIGLDSAVHCFNGLEYGQVMEWKGKIRVNEKPETNRSRKWESRTIDSFGEHVLFPFGRQRNYLMTTFKWPKPE